MKHLLFGLVASLLLFLAAPAHSADLTSVTVAQPAYVCNGTIHTSTWTNTTGGPLQLKAFDIFMGADGGNIADFAVTAYRASDGMLMCWTNWDHYADPTANTNQLVCNFEPDWYTLNAGDSLKLLAQCTGYTAPLKKEEAKFGFRYTTGLATPVPPISTPTPTPVPPISTPTPTPLPPSQTSTPTAAPSATPASISTPVPGGLVATYIGPVSGPVALNTCTPTLPGQSDIEIDLSGFAQPQSNIAALTVVFGDQTQQNAILNWQYPCVLPSHWPLVLGAAGQVTFAAYYQPTSYYAITVYYKDGTYQQVTVLTGAPAPATPTPVSTPVPSPTAAPVSNNCGPCSGYFCPPKAPCCATGLCS